MTTTELLELTQAYNALCLAKTYADGMENKDLSKYANVVFSVWDEFADEMAKKSIPEAKPKVVSVPKVSQAAADAHFNELWELYPSKRGKNSVSASRRVKLYQVSVDAMARAIKRYTDELEQKGKQDYILNGSTWFNGRYADYLDDENYANIDGAKKVDVPEAKKGRFSALTTAEMSDLISRGIITPENESVNYFAMTEMDKRMLTEKGVI